MLFINNKYSKWYNNIILRGSTRILPKGTYSERHHIIPRSLKGSDEKENLVYLTAREHFICHLLLTKMVEGPSRASMCYAAWQMTNIGNRERYSPTSRIYAILRKKLSESYTGRIVSEETRRRIGAKSKGRKTFLGKKHSDETKKRISESKLGMPSPKSEATKKKMSETWLRIAPDRAGPKNGMFGKKHSDKTKEAISKDHLGKKIGPYPVVVCPHCSKIGSVNNMKRWHFDNCKTRKK